MNSQFRIRINLVPTRCHVVAVLLSFAFVLLTDANVYAAPLLQGGSSSRQVGSSSRQNGSASRQVDGEMTEEAKAFRELQIKLKTNQNRIDLLYRTLPIGFPERRAKYKAEIDGLAKANEQLKTEVYAKAKAAFRASDNPSAQSTQIVSRRMAAMLQPRNTEDKFDPEASLELITMLKEKFPENPQILWSEFLANYAIERFENAENALLQFEKVTGKDLTPAKKELQATMEKYQQELMIRRLEATTDDLPRVLLVTSEGDILIELFENHAPNTVANFIHLIRDQKFYDGKLFHLVKPGEYAMSGSPTGDGMGDAGYRIPCECEGEKIRSHFRGTLSMMAPKKDRGGSQFFITQQPNPHTYDGKYTAFGRVIEGLDVVYKLTNVDMTSRMASTTDVSKIERAEVTRARSHAYMPEKVAVSRPGVPEFGNDAGTVVPEEGEIDTPGSFDLLLQGDEGGK